MHKPIRFKDLGLSIQQKQCFSDFNGEIFYGSRIAIIGPNGSGKSTLLKIFNGSWSAYEGSLALPQDLCVGYLPQMINSIELCSGGELLNRAITKVLCSMPNLLLLDEPTNHLDRSNRQTLMNHLRRYQGTLILVSHDVELLRSVDTIWHLQNGKMQVFNGNYDAYQQLLIHKTASLEEELAQLKQLKKETHFALMKEQEKNKRMRIRGEKSIEQRKWPTIRSAAKLGKAMKTGDKRLNQIREKKQHLLNQRSQLFQAEIVQPHFHLNACLVQKTMISIKEATVGFSDGTILLRDLNFHLRAGEKVALCGDNGSGKSTFIKAILEEKEIKKTGVWVLPNRANIGYLDQHYKNLPDNQTVLELVASVMPNAENNELRKHLNHFLFRKNEEVETKIANLSGGEKARLSLCCIAAKPLALVILDEMTNNLDLETRAQVIQVLKVYPGAMIVISHDHDFLNALDIETRYLIQDGKIEWISAFEEIK